MKICLLTYRGNPFSGGQGIYVSALGRELARLGHEVHAVTGPPYPGPVEGMTWHRVPGLALALDRDNRAPQGFPPGGAMAALTPLGLYERAATLAGIFPEIAAFSFRAFYKVRALLERHRFDVIHDNQTLGWGLLPLRALGVPMVATIHHPLTIDRLRGFEPPTSFRHQIGQMLFYPVGMQGFVARRLPRIVTVSRASARAIGADFGVPAERIRVIPNGLDGNGFRPGSPGERVPGRVIYVGNLEDRNKGVPFLLRAVPLSKRLRELMVISASADVPPWAAELVRELGVVDRVRFCFRIGREALSRWYATAEVAVSPSLFEGFGFPAAEAMASGLPLVAARGGALPEVVGETGVLVPPRDPAALAEGIDRLLADPALRARLGRAARERVLAHFRWDEAARRTLAVYEEVIGGATD